jgi:hypothetical protein
VIEFFLCFLFKGAGQFGSVYLVKEKDEKDLFAIKIIPKEKIHKLHLEKHVEV